MSKPLSELADVYYGKSPNEVISDESVIPIIGTGGVYGRASRAMYQGPAVVVPRKGSLGNPQFIGEPFWPADTTYAVLPKPKVDAKWLYYSLAAFDLTKLNEATGVPSINRDWLYRIKLGSDEFDGQCRIAKIISTVDAAIEQTEALIAKYQQIKAGLMQDLFTRGVTPDGHLRPTSAQAPHLYKESPLGWIPKEWDCLATEDKVRVIDAQPDHRTPPEDSEGYPYIGIGDISPAGEVLFGQARRVLSTAFTKQLNSFEVEPGAFIFGKIGTLGSPTRIPHERFFAISANVVLLTSKVSSDANFAFWIYHSQWIERQISDATNTTSQPALGIQKIRKFMLPWPSTSNEREVITSRLENMLEVHQSLEQEKHKMILLKQGLMQDLLTGRVRVKVGEAEEKI